ncbi:MAG: hypothetical protein AB7F64_09930, partial [Gammaproteobacteria bacterium]
MDFVKVSKDISETISKYQSFDELPVYEKQTYKNAKNKENTTRKIRRSITRHLHINDHYKTDLEKYVFEGNIKENKIKFITIEQVLRFLNKEIED